MIGNYWSTRVRCPFCQQTTMTNWNHKAQTKNKIIVDITFCPRCCPRWVTFSIHPISHVPYSSLWANMTSFIKPNVLHCRRSRTEPWPQVLRISWSWNMSFLRYVRGQSFRNRDRHTDMLITINWNAVVGTANRLSQPVKLRIHSGLVRTWCKVLGDGSTEASIRCLVLERCK